MQPAITSYTTTAKAFHWLMALILLALLSVGFYMHDLPLSPHKLQIYSWHKWAGITVLLLVGFRLFWRMTHRPPPLPPSMSIWMRRAAQGGHVLLYLMMVVIPLSGWLMSSAKGFQTVWFGILPLPDLVAKDRALGNMLLTAHQALNYVFIGVLLAHVGAAFKHELIDSDGILRRMLPSRNSKKGCS